MKRLVWVIVLLARTALGPTIEGASAQNIAVRAGSAASRVSGAATLPTLGAGTHDIAAPYPLTLAPTLVPTAAVPAQFERASVLPGNMVKPFPASASQDLQGSGIEGWDKLHIQLVYQLLANPENGWIYGAILAGDQESAEKVRKMLIPADSLHDALGHMYDALHIVVSSGAKPRIRIEAAELMCRAYSAWLDRVAADEAMSPQARRQAALARSIFLDTRAVLHGMLRTRQMSAKLDLVAATLARIDPDGRLAAAPGAMEVEPIIDIVVPSEDAVESKLIARESLDLRRFEKRIDDTQFKLEKAARRVELARTSPVSEATRDRLEQELRMTVRSVASAVPYWRSLASRTAYATYRLAFSFFKRGRVYQVPKTHGLALVPEPGGFRIEALFETDIDDTQAAAVKASIERHWRGAYSERGQPVAIRTLVTIRRALPGSDLGPSALNLRNGGSQPSAAGSAMKIPKGFTDGMPSHEFGHLLGLED